MTMEMYRVTDIQTNTVLENLSIKQVGSTLGVRTGYIHTCIKNGNLIRFRYKVEVVGTVECKHTDIPVELWNEWDKICKPLNRVLRQQGKNILITTLG